MCINKGEIVKGIIKSIYFNEIYVDLGIKYNGYNGIVNRYNMNTNDINIGDEREFIVIKWSNSEGIYYLEEKEHYIKHKNMTKNSSVNEVISHVQKKLSEMKPSLISEITLSVYTQLEKSYNSENQELKNRISELEKRILQLENIIDKLNK